MVLVVNAGSPEGFQLGPYGWYTEVFISAGPWITTAHSFGDYLLILFWVLMQLGFI